MDETRDLQYMKIVADSLKNKYPGSTLVQSLVEDAGRREAQYNNLKFLSQLSEDQVSEAGSVNLVLPDPSGRPVSLESLEGKVVLVNFWASYNQESIRMNENLKNVYRKYQSEGFEVYNISLDADPASWRKAIRFEEYPWIDVRDPDGVSGQAALLYNVQQLPTNYLIDKEGNIVAKNLYGNTLTVWLDNLI